MLTDSPPRKSIVATPEFKRNLRELAKKYRSIRKDVQPIIEQLQAGQIIGVQVPGTQYTIYKARVRNRDIQKGRSAGYRLIYYLQTNTQILLLTIYSKSDQPNISTQQIRKIIQEAE